MGDGDAPVGLEGRGLRLTGVLVLLSRGPPTVALGPSARAPSAFFSVGVFSAFGRVS